MPSALSMRAATCTLVCVGFLCACGDSSGDAADADAASSVPDDAAVDAAQVPDAAGDLDASLPLAEGTFQLTTEVAIAAIIPDQTQAAISRLGKIATSPSEALLNLLAAAAVDPSAPYWQDAAWTDLLDEDASGEPILTAAGAGVAQIIDADLLDNLTKLGIAAGAPEEVFGHVLDVVESASQYRLAGNLYLVRDPDADGSLGSENALVYTRVDWVWDGPENPSTFVIPDARLPANLAITARLLPPATAGAGPFLEIDPYELPLDQARLLSWVVAYAGFPHAITAEVSGFTALASYLLDCPRLADRLSCEGAFAADPDCDASYASWHLQIEAACVALQLDAEPAVEAWLRIAGNAVTWQVSRTASGAPCPSTLSGSGPARIDALGAAGTGSRCAWETHLGCDGCESGPALPSTWWAERLQ